MNKFQTTPKNQPITLDFNGIDVTITGFQLIYSNSEDFKNIICNYPQHVQGHLKEMRRKMKNRVSFGNLYFFSFYQNYLVRGKKNLFLIKHIIFSFINFVIFIIRLYINAIKK